MSKVVYLICFLIAAFVSNAQVHPFGKKLNSIGLYVDTLMKDWNIPGLAITIVYKDQVIYAKGFGYRDAENKLPVDTKTLFPIGSNTKLFTALTVSMLAEEQKLSLDKPVRNYKPSLVFSTDELNAKVTLRDMLSHRTGLPNQDQIWVGSNARPEEIASKVVYIVPTLNFREGVIYNNVMYISVGAVIETVTGLKWEDNIRKNFLQPLRMNATCFGYDEMMKSSNFAYSYTEADSSGVLKRVTRKAITNASLPTGGINSNLEDMQHWMIALLNGGKYRGVQVISESAIKQTLVPNILYDKEAKWPELSFSAYGLGRWMQTYKGYKVAMHTGGTPDGYYSNLTLLPSENIAVFIAFNSNTAGVIRPVVALPVIDMLLGLSHTPWTDRYMKEYVETKSANEKAAQVLSESQVKNTSPSHPLNAYVGTYTSPIYGDGVIELKNDSLIFTYRDVKTTLHHFHYDQFIVKDALNGRPGRLKFLTNNRGEIDRFVTFVDKEFVKK